MKKVPISSTSTMVAALNFLPCQPGLTNRVMMTSNLMNRLDSIRTLDDLRSFVHQTLCDRENILADQFGLTEIPLVRGGQTCGREFAVQGPRSIRLAAIWAADHNTLYFYDARGNRFLKVQLPQRLALAA